MGEPLPMIDIAPLKRITLHGMGSTWNGFIDASPFVVRVLAFMNLHRIPYNFRSGQMAPVSNRIPWMEVQYLDSNNVVTVEDSQKIVEFLAREICVLRQTLGGEADTLTGNDRQRSDVLRLLCDNVLYHCAVRMLWVDGSGPNSTHKYVETQYPIPLPGLMKRVLLGKIRELVIKDLNSHGLGDDSKEDYPTKGVVVLRELIQQLGGKDFMFGTDRPMWLDCIAFFYFEALVKLRGSGVLCAPFEALAVEYEETLVKFCSRMRRDVFGGDERYQETVQKNLQRLRQVEARYTSNMYKAVAVTGVVVASGAWFAWSRGWCGAAAAWTSQMGRKVLGQ